MRGEIVQALTSLGLVVNPVSSMHDILGRLFHFQPALVFVDASAGEDEASSRVVELSNAEKLQQIPVYFLSHQAVRRIDPLKRQFVNLVPVDMPYRLDDLVRSFREMLGLTSEPGENKDKEEIQETEARREQQSAESEARRKAIIKASRDPLRLDKGSGGRVFSLARGLEDFDDRILIPTSADTVGAQRILDGLTRKDLILGLHSRRTAFVATALAQSLRYSRERIDNITLSSLLLNTGLSNAPLWVRRYDPIREDSYDSLTRMVEGFKSSAKMVERDAKSSEAAVTINRVADHLLGTQEPNTSLETDQNAQCVLLIELAARACWGTGFWSHYGAYRMLRYLARDEFLPYDKSILAAMLRTIAEAVCSFTTVCNIFTSRSREEREEVFAKFEEHIKAVTGAAKRCEIFDLRSGMVLAGPLLSFDGEVVLDGGLRLNDGIIHSLWELAAVRALTKTAVVLDG